MSVTRSPQSGAIYFHVLMSRCFHPLIYFENNFRANLKYSLSLTNWSAKPTAKPTDLKMPFLLLDEAELKFSREKVHKSVSKYKPVPEYPVTLRPSMGVACSELWDPAITL